MTALGTDDFEGGLLGDRYELAARLGEGGMGVVYRARDTTLRRDVAVKVFRDVPAEMTRTASEIRLLAGLNHPALVTLYDAHFGVDEPGYLVMEYVDGPTLQTRLQRGPLSGRSAARIGRDLGEALHAVHSAGIVHRDIKPANVLLRGSSVPGREYHAKLADFGIAHLIDTTRLTTPGTIIGSAAYLSPEQVTGSPPLPSSDIYSLGLVLLEAVTGDRAFPQDGMREAVLARLAQDPVIPAAVGQGWAALLTVMTARDPETRPSALDVVSRLRTLRSITDDPAATVRAPSAASPIATATTAATVAQDAPETTTRILTDDSTTPLDSDERPPSPRRSRPVQSRRRTRAIGVTLALITLVAGLAVTALAMGNSEDSSTLPPDLPAVEEPLAAHLQQLLDAVSP